MILFAIWAWLFCYLWYTHFRYERRVQTKKRRASAQGVEKGMGRYGQGNRRRRRACPKLGDVQTHEAKNWVYSQKKGLTRAAVSAILLKVMRVQVYYNLHKKRLSVRNRGKVIKHTDIIALENVKFHVQPAGQAKVRKNKRKNVHAYVSGDLAKKQAVNSMVSDLVKYNPYKNDFFVDEKGNEMRDIYPVAFIIKKEIFVKKAWLPMQFVA